MSRRHPIPPTSALLLGLSLPLFLGSCVMKRTVTEGGAVVSHGYIVERPLKAMHDLETTGPDEDDNN